MQEFRIIKKYFSNLTKNDKKALNLNDDVFFDKKRRLVISVDTYVEKIHFINFTKPDLVIKKIIRSSISDLICKGVQPRYYFISGSGSKKTFSKINLKKIKKSLRQEQNKFSIYLGGGDTVSSKKLSFTITTIGYSNKIIYRNKAKKNDDIYVTGDLGDSFAGLMILKKKINTNSYLRKFFINKYFIPDLQLKLSKRLFSMANTSIDLSDGLISDLEKLINKQKLSYKIYLDKVPISKNLKKLIITKKLNKKNFVSRGDDYQILFTASPSKSRIIRNIGKSLKIKISKIGKICSSSQISQIFDENTKKTKLKNKGYYHNF